MKPIYRLHAWVGLISGVMILIICLTGSLSVFKPELDRALDPVLRQLPEIPAQGRRVSLDEVAARVAERYPEGRVLAVCLPTYPGSQLTHGRVISVWMGAKRPHPTEVLVHPYTGEILGARRRLEGWGQWIRDFHSELFSESWGRVFVGFLGLLIAFSTVTGLIIFTRFNKGSWWPQIRWHRGGRIVLADLHKTVGLVTALLSLILALTGAVLGLETLYERYVSPPASWQVLKVRPDPGPALPGIFESSLAQAREVFPHGIPTRVMILGDERPITLVIMDHPAQTLVRENSSYVKFDATTGKLMEVHNEANAGFGARVHYAMEPLHFGRLGGSMTLRVIYATGGALIGLLSISGYVIYVIRKLKSRASRSRRLARAGRGARPIAHAAGTCPTLPSQQPTIEPAEGDLQPAQTH